MGTCRLPKTGEVLGIPLNIVIQMVVLVIPGIRCCPLVLDQEVEGVDPMGHGGQGGLHPVAGQGGDGHHRGAQQETDLALGLRQPGPGQSNRATCA